MEFAIQNYSDVSETEQSRAKVITVSIETRIGLQPIDWWQLNMETYVWTLAYISGEQNFSTADISHTFCDATKFGNIEVSLANRNLFPEFDELRSSGHVIPCGDMHQSFTHALVKWFFDNFLMFADSFSILSIHCVAQELGNDKNQQIAINRPRYSYIWREV